MYGKNLKLVLRVMLLLVSKATFSQVTERERPKEWSQLVKGARFMDRFLPMKGNQLSSRTVQAQSICLKDFLKKCLR